MMAAWLYAPYGAELVLEWTGPITRESCVKHTEVLHYISIPNNNNNNNNNNDNNTGGAPPTQSADYNTGHEGWSHLEK